MEKSRNFGQKRRKMNERLKQFLEFQGLSVRQFELMIGSSDGKIAKFMTTNSSLKSDTLSSIMEKFPQLSIKWLLTGEGEMLNKPAASVPSEEEAGKPAKKVAPAKLPVEGVRLPLVTQTAIAGFGNANFAIREADIKEYYVVPKFRYCQVDFMIEISGSSMYPKYNSGDVVACTILRDGAFIQWNKCHIVATREQGILCKRIMPGTTEDTLMMISDNNDYPPFEVPKQDITGLALVIGVIRLE